MDLIGTANWDAFKTLITEDAADTFFQDIVTWKKVTADVDRWMEDSENKTVQDVELKCLFSYNYLRQWEVNKSTEEGILDKATQAALFSMKYLDDQGLINAKGFFDYDIGRSRFVHKGILYKPMGDTLLSQAQDEPLMFMIVLQRIETPTGEDRTHA